MFRTTLVALIAALAASAAPPNNCTEIPVQWTVNNIYVDGVTPSLITNDGTASYVNGQSGVVASLSTCGDMDAVISFGTSQRSISFHFIAPLYTDQYTPAGLAGSTMRVDSVNIRNILYRHNASGDYTFTTRMGSNFLSFGPFRMVNPYDNAVTAVDATVNAANSPIADALVYVHHCPVASIPTITCPSLSHETYFVYPDQTAYGTSQYTGNTIAQPGTVILTEGNGKNAHPVNAGEFSMPFYFAISLVN